MKPIITFEVTVTSKAGPDAVYDVLADPSTHLEWAGEQAPRKDFRLLTLRAPKGGASVGTRFTSTGTSSKDGSPRFHDTSTVTEASTPSVFAFTTDSRLERKRRPTWDVRFDHRYEVEPEGNGSRITYTVGVFPLNYRPCWLHPFMRPVTRRMINTVTAKHMANLARMAETVPSTRGRV